MDPYRYDNTLTTHLYVLSTKPYHPIWTWTRPVLQIDSRLRKTEIYKKKWISLNDTQLEFSVMRLSRSIKRKTLSANKKYILPKSFIWS